MHRFLVAGGPGAGKTTLLSALAARGYAIRGDSAREIIARRKAAGLAPRPQPARFAEEILCEDMAKYQPALNEGPDTWVYFERGVLDALGLAFDAGSLQLSELQVLLGKFNYEPAAFLLPPWEAIYVRDEERDQSFDEAVAVYGKVLHWYARCGYTVHEVPRASVEERVDYVLRVSAESVA